MEASIAAIEAQCKIDSQPEEGDVTKNEGKTPWEQAQGRNRGNFALTCQASGGKCKEPKQDANMWYVGEDTLTCTSVQTVQLSAQKSITVIKTKIVLDFHEDTYEVGDHCLIIHDHNKLMNVFGFDP